MLIAASALAHLIPNKDGSTKPKSFPFINLIPNITKGLELIGTDAPPASSGEARIGVFDSEEVLPMTLRDYLVGVTAAEMPAGYGIEALKAQAVAARTFTVKHITGELRCRSGHTVCTDHRCCQAYISVERMRQNWGDRFDERYAKICEAVDSTEGIVMMSGGELVTALYHSSSGGRTENCEAVFAVALPYLVSVESAGEEDSPEYSSTVSFSKEEFIERINSAFPDAGIAEPSSDVDIWQRTDSGRVSLIRLGGTVVSGQQLRNALSLKSTNIEFDIDGDTVEISCLGFGHGVGMSQCGANAMAKEGADYEAILKHYYTGVELARYTVEVELWRILCGESD
ncbi:MAG: stage II sporulation protein D [Clostridia bacterium]|nr:stage II sporulation protein D [Clostridia bacterium]